MKKNKNTSQLKINSRAALIERVKRELERRGYPRLQMLLLVCLTGGAGFLASYGLLYAGLTSLAVRYGLAVRGNAKEWGHSLYFDESPNQASCVARELARSHKNGRG